MRIASWCASHIDHEESGLEEKGSRLLKRIVKGNGKKTGGRYAIVASRYNGRYVDALVRSVRSELAVGGAEMVEVHRVPGAFEIPVVAAILARDRQPPFDAIICLGVIFQGETAHARQIGDAVSSTLAALQVEHRVPVIHGVYLFDNEDQARVRCLGREHNRGIEAARTALEMTRVLRRLRC
jgi:6,7-dimethyl-8-ribityllumazine synthase